MEEDIEIPCDKLVIQNIGDSVSHRKQYCNSMLNLLKKRLSRRGNEIPSNNGKDDNHETMACD